MPSIEAGDVLGAFTTAMDIYVLARRNRDEARQRALKAGYTEAELDAIRDGALATFMEPLVDPLDGAEDDTNLVDPPAESGP